MADEFYITRHSGVNIFIDVDKGIVTNVHNERPKFIEKMNELYKGKSITYLKENFEKRMLPTTVLVRSTDVCHAQQNLNTIDAILNTINRQLNELKPQGNIRYVGRNAAQHKIDAESLIKTKTDELNAAKARHTKERNVRVETLENVLKYVKEIHNFG